VTLVVLSNWV